MKKAIKNSANGTRLLIEAGNKAKEFEERMLAAVTDSSLMAPDITYLNGIRYYSYSIEGRICLTDYLNSRKLKLRDLRDMLITPGTLAEKLLSYMLNEENLILDKDCIYVDPSNGKLFFAGASGRDRPFRDELKEYLRFILSALDPDEPSGLRFGFEIFRLTVLYDPGFNDVLNILRTYVCEPVNKEYGQDFVPGLIPVDTDTNVPSGSDQYVNTAAVIPVLSALSDRIRSIIKKDRAEYDKPDILPDTGSSAGHDTSDDTSYDTEGPDPSLIKLLISLIILFLGMLAIYIFMGLSAALKAVPAFAILGISLTVYFMISFLRDRRIRVREL